MPTVDIQVPMVSKKLKPVIASSSASQIVSNKNTLTLFNQLTGSGGGDKKEQEEEDQEQSNEEKVNPARSFNFVVMTKKGNKTQYHNMEVPVTSEFAQQFRAREEVCRETSLKNNFSYFKNRFFKG